MHINLPLEHLWSEPSHWQTPSDLLILFWKKTEWMTAPCSGKGRFLQVRSTPGAGVLSHHVQELALLGQTGEHRAHVPNGHVADARGDGGQSQGAPWGGEAGGALGEAVQEAWAQGAREQARVIAVIHDGVEINLGGLQQLGVHRAGYLVDPW